MCVMMQRGLAAARLAWIDESINDVAREKREPSDFLTYQNEDGLLADFHANPGKLSAQALTPCQRRH